jgi:hypothetical protein
MPLDREKSQFVASKEQFFDPLCQSLALRPVSGWSGRGFAVVAAELDYLRIYFEHERGLCQFSVGAVSESRQACSVEAITDRFARVRTLEGRQRLSLEEQRDFLVLHWQELQSMFPPEGIETTKAWLLARAAALTARYTGHS